MKSFISSLEIIDVVAPDPNILLWIAVSVADAAAGNHNWIKTHLANGLSTFFIKGNEIFSNGPEGLPKNPRDCAILCNWVFDNFVLADESFAKGLWRLKTCGLVKNISSLEFPIKFDERFKVASVPFFIPNFSFLSCELDSFTFKVWYWVVLH